MTYDGGRALDDQPLAAYGGSGMELTAEDAAKIETAVEAAADDADAPQPAAGPFAHVTSTEPGLEGEPAGPGPGSVAQSVAGPILAGATVVATRGVSLLRTSRPAQGVAFGAVIVVGVLLLVGGGPKPGAAGAEASPSAPAVAFATHEPGSATLELTGKVEQSLTFAGMTGAGAPNAPLAATWTDTTLNSLGLDGTADRGTRSTDERLVLRFTVMVGEKPISFSSTQGECTIGMGVNPTNVFGTFSCKRLKSDDGKYVVGATGTYRT